MRVLPIVAVLASAALAHADPKDDSPGRGRAQYEEGQRHYNLGEYDEAILAFREAYLLSSAPSLLYNIAQAYRLRGPGNCGHALTFYRSYLRERPNAADREKVERLAASVEECARTEKPAPEPKPRTEPATDSKPPDPGKPTEPSAPVEESSPPPPPPVVSKRASHARWALVGTGATLAVAGGVMQVLARMKFYALQDECPCEPARWQNWQRIEYASYGLMGVGAVTAVVGFVWRREDGTETMASVVPLNGGAAFTVRGAF